MYTPILKGKGGEFEALAHLDRALAGELRPLIEAVPTGQATDLDVSALVRKLLVAWPLGEAVAVDLNYYLGSDDQADRWRRLLEEARYHQVKVVPVAHFDDGSDTLAALRDAMDVDARGCCLRVDAPHLEEDPGDLGAWMSDLLAQLHAGPKDIDLVLDCGALANSEAVAWASARASVHLENLPWLERWRTVVVAGGGFPKNLSGVKAWTATPLRRREVDLWGALSQRRHFFPRQPSFGDYGVGYPPHTEPVPARPPPNVRYAVDGEWRIVRGTKNDPRGNEQYREICKLVADWPEHQISQQCWGDASIASVAEGRLGPGNPLKWRAYSTSRHLDYVRSKLATLGEP